MRRRTIADVTEAMRPLGLKHVTMTPAAMKALREEQVQAAAHAASMIEELDDLLEARGERP